MLDQYFGHKELYEVVLKAKEPMRFGNRYIEAGEPVLYFENVDMSMLNEQNRAIFARGGWANQPRVTWEDRSEVTFSMTEGVMSSVGMSILLSANVTQEGVDKPIPIQKREGPLEITELNDQNHGFYISHKPIGYPEKKIFIMEYSRDAVQKKVYGRLTENQSPLGPQYFISVYDDKDLTIPVDVRKQFVVDYYYEYGKEALVYSVQKERFNGLFTLEGKFYSKDENEGHNYTNILYMPKLRIVSNINLRLGERADPTVSTFNIVGLPDVVGNKKDVIVEIIKLGEDIDDDM